MQATCLPPPHPIRPPVAVVLNACPLRLAPAPPRPAPPQIASMVSVQGRSAGPVVKNIMTLGTCAPIVGAEVMSFSRWGGVCSGCGA